MTKTVLIFFSILMLSSSQLLGQVVKRNETTGAFKFTHEISSYASYFRGIQSPKISVMWNSLMGEPIEDYKFYWEYGKFLQAIHYNGLPLEDYLENHSDLLKRFKGVIPKFDIFFQIKLENCEGDYCEETFERTISSNMMIVANAGKKINISVPSSPKDWYVFFGIDKDWAGSKTRVDKLYEAFRKAKNIYILSVRLYNLEWGDQIESIIRELERRREREKKKKAEENGNKTVLEDQVDEEWATDVTDNEQEDTNSDIGEWATEKANNETTIEEPTSWSNEGAAIDNEWAQSNLEKNASNKSKFEIKYQDRKAGVVDEDGNILIPFKYEKILKYEDGMATVRIKTNEEWLGCTDGYSWNLEFFDQVIVDKNGSKLIEPLKVVVFTDYYTPELTLRYEDNIPFKETSLERMQRERREAARKEKARIREKKLNECLDDSRSSMKTIKQVFVANGGIVEGF